MRSFSEYNPIAVAVWFFSVTGVAMFCSYPILMAISLSGAVLFFLIRNGFTHGKTHLFFWLLFAVLALANPLVSHNGKTVLSAKNFDFADSIKATLDISAAANLKNAGSGTMTLLASGTDNDFSSLNLKYYDNNTATLNSGTSSVDVFKKSNYENEKNGVTLTYDTKHTVALDITNYNKVTYTVVANSAVKTVSFGNSIAWSEGGTVRDVSGEGFTFNGTTAINAANLGFTGKANTALKTDGSSFMTLVKGATGITDTNLTPITAGNGTVDVAYEDAGKIKYAATASGTVSVDATAGDVKYTVDKDYQKSVKLFYRMAYSSLPRSVDDPCFDHSFMNYFRIIEASANELIDVDNPEVKERKGTIKYSFKFTNNSKSTISRKIFSIKLISPKLKCEKTILK